MKAHAAVAAELLGSEELVAQVLRDPAASDLTAKEKALFRFVEKVNQESPDIHSDDIEALHTAGWGDEAIYDAITVCALFNFYNRWIDGSGVPAMTDEQHRAAAKRMAKEGYVRSKPATGE